MRYFLKKLKKVLDKHTTLYYIIHGKAMENKITQLRKGILELAVLGCLYNERHYGYSLIKTLIGEGELEITEGTIYPILSRLLKEELVRAEWVESNQGPPRKYYFLTAKGEQVFKVLNAEFAKLAAMVANAVTKQKKSSQDEEYKILTVKKESEDGQ
jgi:PadR family transcriptional regulator PadR